MDVAAYIAYISTGAISTTRLRQQLRCVVASVSSIDFILAPFFSSSFSLDYLHQYFIR